MRGQANNPPFPLIPVPPPRILVIDDLFGRITTEGANPERRDLCGQFLLQDITGDLKNGHGSQTIKHPTAQAVFCRGQTPADAAAGDTVENDLDGTLRLVRKHWLPDGDVPPLSMVLLDLCFYTGKVTAASENSRGEGMPEGRDGDDQAKSYFGLAVLEALHDRFPDLPVVILSSMPRDAVSRQFSRLGALGFLPRGEADSPALLHDYLERHGLISDTSGTVVGRSKGLLLALRAARRAAVGRKNVLLRGDTGTGKDLLAWYLHDQTPGIGDSPYIAVDSGALSPSLYASELFGHRRGAFTGATADRTGRIVQADGGDIFLDEIGNMPDDVQVGLLRAIEHRVVTPVGAQEGQQVNVRFITATNVDIEGKAATGHGFRTDLYYRLREGGAIYLPPLRERREDIPLLAEKFLRDAEATTPSALHRAIDPEALEILTQHDWPGNIRELHETISRAVNDNPDVEHLMPVHLQLSRAQPPAVDNKDSETYPPRQAEAGKSSGSADSGDLRSLLASLAHIDFSAEGSRRSEWVGQLPKLQAAFARAAARLLRAALVATSKPTLERPEGELVISRAVKLATGDGTISGYRPADIIKRVLSIDGQVHAEMMEDPVLRRAYEKAVAARPKGRKRRTTRSEE